MSQLRFILPMVAMLVLTSAIAAGAGAGERRDGSHPSVASDIEQIGAASAHSKPDDASIAPSAISVGVLQGGNTARITQRGVGHQAEVRQQGNGLESTVEQSGTGGIASVDQSGTDLNARVEQFGASNGVQVFQSGVGNGSTITVQQY
jgi:hypothetical protein